jgi:polar amino acid transport system substrate-binding protein
MTTPPFPTSLTRRALCTGSVTAAATTLLLPAVARAAPLRITVGEIGPVTPALIESVQAAYAKLPGVTIEVTTAPFARSIASVLEGAADLHVPMLRPPHSADALPFAITTANEYEVPFVLYTNKDTPLDLSKLGSYEIETDVAHVGYFDFKINPSAGFEASLQKLDAGRLDGYIFAGNVIDPILQQLALKNVRRKFFKSFASAAVLPKSGVGGAVDKQFGQAVAAAANDPAFTGAIRKILAGYKGTDWQQS